MKNSLELAQNVRRTALQMVHQANASHIGGALSMTDLLAVLYTEILKVDHAAPKWADRDRFILSKGHSVASLYATLAWQGFFPLEQLQNYGKDNSLFMTHVSHKIPGVDFSTGSLGHGLPFGLGRALAAQRKKLAWRTFVMLSDGELDEGSNWEAILLAPHLHLDNLIAIVDYNKIQSLGSVADVLPLDSLADKFKAFHWAVREIDGHDHAQIRAALSSVPWEPSKPSCLIAHTVKGKGVDFMENQLRWHYSSPNAEQLQNALSQIS
jgi:transketolase